MRRYIDADILKNKTTRVNHIWNGTTNAEGKGLDEIIDDIPIADVRENVRGHWELKTSDLYGLADKVTAWANYCSVCGYHYGTPYNFCPHCGADMRGDNNGKRNEQ